jgi:hypothetical protein
LRRTADIDLEARLDEYREALRPFVVGQVSTLPKGILILVSPEDLERAKRLYRDCPLEAA